ncbi:hypothetical protein Q3G72_008030 [Acer saccharum]|nr:hypothetical protein Q3G72_008030 [Acer saccharum]
MKFLGGEGPMGPTPSGSWSPSKKRTSKPRTTIESLDRDILCIIFSSLGLFDLVHCSVVCKSWNAVINRCKSLQVLYLKLQRDSSEYVSNTSGSSRQSMSTLLEELAMKHHRMSLEEGRIDIDQWKGHSVGVDQCRMKSGMILTGVGDKVPGHVQTTWSQLYISRNLGELGQRIEDVSAFIEVEETADTR